MSRRSIQSVNSGTNSLHENEVTSRASGTSMTPSPLSTVVVEMSKCVAKSSTEAPEQQSQSSPKKSRELRDVDIIKVVCEEHLLWKRSRN